MFSKNRNRKIEYPNDQEQLSEFRVKEERLEKQFHRTDREIKHLREKCAQLERSNKELQKDTENWLHAKTSLQVF